jgi:hypothetical protein
MKANQGVRLAMSAKEAYFDICSGDIVQRYLSFTTNFFYYSVVSCSAVYY